MKLPCGFVPEVTDAAQVRRHLEDCPTCHLLFDALYEVLGDEIEAAFALAAKERERLILEARRKREQAEYAGRLRRLRRCLRLTQAALAEEMGVSRTTVTRWETGRLKPSRLARQSLRLLERSARIQ